MRHSKLLVALAVLVGGLFFVGNFATVSAGEPKQVKLDYVKGKKGAVNFDHAMHNATGKCADCHHKGGNQKCFDCHKEKKTDENKIDIKKAFHKQCKDCHKKSGKETAPTKCKGCHP